MTKVTDNSAKNTIIVLNFREFCGRVFFGIVTLLWGFEPALKVEEDIDERTIVG